MIGVTMEYEQFRQLVTAPGPFVSVYLDDSRDTSDAMGRLEARWRDVRNRLDSVGVAEKIVVALEEAILRGQPAVGRQGHAVIVSRYRILVNEHLMSPPPDTVLRVSDYPYILPLVEFGRWRPTYLFAAVDHNGADVAVHRGDAIRSEVVDGGGYPVHKPATAGFSGYGDFQRTTEEAVRMNIRAVAERLTELVDETGAEVVFISGEVRSRSDLVSALPDRIVTRVTQLHAGARTSGGREEEAVDQVAAEFERRRRAALADIVARFEAESGNLSGLAAEGIPAVCAALRAGDVDTLIVGRLGDATVVTAERRALVAPDPDVLSELGEAPYRVTRADEALPFAAISIDAAVVGVDDLMAPADGIAALLRYAVPGIGQHG